MLKLIAVVFVPLATALLINPELKDTIPESAEYFGCMLFCGPFELLIGLLK